MLTSKRSKTSQAASRFGPPRAEGLQAFIAGKAPGRLAVEPRALRLELRTPAEEIRVDRRVLIEVSDLEPAWGAGVALAVGLLIQGWRLIETQPFGSRPRDYVEVFALGAGAQGLIEGLSGALSRLVGG